MPPRNPPGQPPHSDAEVGPPSSDRRREIVSIAAEIFAQQGVQATTVRQIGDRAGILSGSLYHHFRSKLDIVDAILAEFCEQVLAEYRALTTDTSDPVEAFGNMVERTVAIMARNPAAVQILERDAGYLRSQKRFDDALEFLHESQAAWEAVIARGVESGDFRPDLDPRMHYWFVRWAIAGCVEHLQRPDSPAIEVASAALRDLLVLGLRRRD